MKFNIKSPLLKGVLGWGAAFLGLEILSFSSFLIPELNPLFFGLVILGVLVVSAISLEAGLLAVFAELFIGSFGYLFYYQLGDFKLPLRMALWAVVLGVFLIKFAYQLFVSGKASPFLKKLQGFAWLKDYTFLFIFLIIGLIIGWERGHDLKTIFLDFNAWLYFALLFPAATIFSQADKKQYQRLTNLFLAACLWLSLKTLILLFIFTHNLSIAPDVYLWLRRHLLGEMTATLGGWPRVFIQAQIFPIMAFFLILFHSLKTEKLKGFFKTNAFLSILAAALFLSAALVSFSRSFWAGLAAALGLSLIIIWRYYSFKKMLIALVWSACAFILGFLLVYLTAIFPYPKPGAFQADFLDRLSNQNEAALSSRWSLLPVLAKAIGQEPFFGQGFGATLTYFSQDPRVLEKGPTGRYTTFAFEWGYLDIALKIGLVGLLAYLLLIFKLVRAAWSKPDYLSLGLGAAIFFLAVVNFFTPYLNHPLGLGFLLLSSCLIPLNRV